MKRVVIVSISYLVYAFTALRTAILRRVSSNVSGTCVVLYYHQIRPEHRARFARQMDNFLRYAVPVQANRSEALTPGIHHAAITFDDGFENVFENALPELEKRRIPAAIFVITEAMGGYPNWLTSASHSARSEKVASSERLRELDPSLATIGSHTMTHPALLKLNSSDAEREVSGSKVNLEQALGRNVELFSFPFGEFDASLIALCKQAGYERVFTTLPCYAFKEQKEFVTGRVSVEPTDSTLEFHLKLMGAYRWLPPIYAAKRRLRRWTGRKRERGAEESVPKSAPHSV